VSKNLFAIVTSKITDHHNKHNNNESFKYSENYQNVTQKHKGTNAKNVLIDFSRSTESLINLTKITQPASGGVVV